MQYKIFRNTKDAKKFDLWECNDSGDKLKTANSGMSFQQAASLLEFLETTQIIQTQTEEVS